MVPEAERATGCPGAVGEVSDETVLVAHQG